MKLYFVVLFLALSCSAYGRYSRQEFQNTFEDFEKSISERILNGFTVPIDKAPFMALVYADKSYMGDYPHATAVIISPHYLLSSASFFYKQKGKKMVAYLGESDLTSFKGKTKYNVSEVIIHEKFNSPVSRSANIALIKLNEGIKYNNYQMPISLPSPNNVPQYKGWPDIYGFGFSKRNGDDRTIVLKTAKVYIKSNDLKKSFFELPAVSTCPGDTGAPLVWGSELVAIITDANNRCEGTASAPVYAIGVEKYYDWILRKIGERTLNDDQQNVI